MARQAEAQVELQIANVLPEVGYGPSSSTFGAARDVTGQLVLAPLARGASGSTVVDASTCIPVPATVDERHAMLIPMLAVSLWAWHQLDLELGETAVYTSGTPFDHLIGRVASWRGALPVIRLGAGTPRIDGVETVDSSNPQQAMEQLAKQLRGVPGFAAVELSGRAEVLDILLEVLPRWGRILLAAPASTPATVDFYNNVHRKGANIRAVLLDPMLVFDPAKRAHVEVHVQRTVRILANPELARGCLPA